MAKINFEKFIKELPPELQKRARACKSAEELLELADRFGFELPVTVLETYAGGCGIISAPAGGHTESDKYSYRD